LKTFEDDWNAEEVPISRVRKLYRRRFGIENRYRLLEQVSGKTTAHDPTLRFLGMGLALLLGNSAFLL
jgi:IS4 transposase